MSDAPDKHAPADNGRISSDVGTHMIVTVGGALIAGVTLAGSPGAIIGAIVGFALGIATKDK